MRYHSTYVKKVASLDYAAPVNRVTHVDVIDMYLLSVFWRSKDFESDVLWPYTVWNFINKSSMLTQELKS